MLTFKTDSTPAKLRVSAEIRVIIYATRYLFANSLGHIKSFHLPFVLSFSHPTMVANDSPGMRQRTNGKANGATVAVTDVGRKIDQKLDQHSE